MRIRKLNRPLLLSFALVVPLLFARPALADTALAPNSRTNGTAGGPSNRVEETNTQDVIRSYLQVQEQLHATQLAIERYRKEADEAALQNSRALAENARELSDRLKGIEESIGSHRAREWEAMQASNRVILIVAGVFAVIGFGALLLMTWFQWRALNRLGEISTALPLPRGLPPAPAIAALGPGSSHAVTVGAAEASNIRLMTALEELEKRILGLEHLSHMPAAGLLRKAASEEPRTGNSVESEAGSPGGAQAASDGNGDVNEAIEQRVEHFLQRGQLLLEQNKLEESLASFEEVLKLEPENTEALLKKGTVLERSRKLDEAIACYDRAIAADSSLTIAWLYKGGLFNRMQRYTEALECYEKALHSQERRAS